MSGLLHRFVRGENDLPDSRARRSGKPVGQHFDLDALLIQTRNQEVVQLVRLDAEDRFFLRDQAFFHHLRCATRTAASPVRLPLRVCSM